MSLLAVGVILLALYATLTILTPVVLGRPTFIVRHPVACLRLWQTSFAISAVSISTGLGLFIALALRHHLTHVPGHDTLSPLIDSVLGWLSIAVVGILAFRMGVAVQDARAAVNSMTVELAPLIAGATRTEVASRILWVVDANVPLMGARAGRVLGTSAVVERLTPQELHAVVEHEHAHLLLNHARVIATANIAEAIAPSVKAGTGFASAARITTELIADDAAARVCGPLVLADALNKAYPSDLGVHERVLRLRSQAN